jgi:transposase
MKDTVLYEQLLGLKAPWSVRSVELSMKDKRVVVEVVVKRGQVWADLADASKRAHIHDWREREWRHLDTCGFETVIRSRIPQLKHSDGSVLEVAVPWAERYARVTKALEGFVVQLLQACPNIKSVGELTGLAWSTVNDIMIRAVERGLLRRNAEPGRTLEAAKELIATLSPTQQESVQAVAMDMWQAYQSAVQTSLPQADIVHDRFHVAKYLNEAVDQVRRAEHRELKKTGPSALTGSKWRWLKTYADGRSAEAVAFRALNQLNLKTSRAWRIKETFASFWSYRYTAAAQRFFHAWAGNAMRSRLDPVKKVVRMLRRHETGLLNYSKHRISNACAEGFNSAIQLIKTNARGLRNFGNYRARILFRCGKLDMGLE